jgi:glycosyltransferase involved in cell wall biosynthesis
MGAPGCDDAPVVDVPIFPIPVRAVTVIYPYYENPGFLATQMAHLAALPEVLRNQVSVIVVDDGSPEHPADEAIEWRALLDGGLSARLFRIEVDVRWNWLAARNIGAYHATEEWLLITDMDHVIPHETMRVVICGELAWGTIYRFSRTGAKSHPHPNSWLYTKQMFWQIGGYDERMSGHYGSDGYYRRRCAATAPIRILSAPLELHEHEGDASTVRYKRKQPVDANLKQIVRRFPPKSKPLTLSFPYHEVQL